MWISTIKKNFFIIFLTLISALLLLFIIKWLLESTMIYVERFTKSITYKFILKLKWDYLLAFCESNILITPIVLSILLRKYLGNFSILIGFLILFIWTLITSYIRKEKSNMFSLINYISARVNTDNYFINRINLFFEQGLSIITLIAAFQFTILIFTQLEWPMLLQYISFILLPIYLNVWIYFSCKFKLKDDTTITIRRIIVYVLLVVYVLGDSYSKFYSIVSYDTSPKLNLINLFVYIASVFFIALERVMKSIIDDFKSFRQKVDNN